MNTNKKMTAKFTAKGLVLALMSLLALATLGSGCSSPSSEAVGATGSDIYSASCSDCGWNGRTLTCLCNNESGGQLLTQLDTSGCPGGSRIDNLDGCLECHNGNHIDKMGDFYCEEQDCPTYGWMVCPR